MLSIALILCRVLSHAFSNDFQPVWVVNQTGLGFNLYFLHPVWWSKDKILQHGNGKQE